MSIYLFKLCAHQRRAKIAYYRIACLYTNNGYFKLKFSVLGVIVIEIIGLVWWKGGTFKNHMYS